MKWIEAMLALGAGLLLALMETAAILSQPGAATGSSLDLMILVTWLAVPYAVALAAGGIAGAAILSTAVRAVTWRPAFAAASFGLAFMIWLRTIGRLGGGLPVYPVLSLLVAAVAAAGGAAAGMVVERLQRSGNPRGAIAGVAGSFTGLALLVSESRNVPGPFGRALPPPAFAVRLSLAVASAILVGLIVRKVLEMIDPWRRPRQHRGVAVWSGRAIVAACAVWLGFAAYDFSAMLSRAPQVTAPHGGAAGEGVSASSSSQAGRPSVVLISIDTLRADHLSCYGYTKQTSPQIDRLAADGVLFTHTASTASFTLPAHASMMTGLFPSSHGATYQNRDPRSFTVRGMGSGFPTLAEILRDHGYETAGFVSGPLVSHQFGFSRGFMTYDDRYDRLQTARARLFARSVLFRWMLRAGVFSWRDLDSQRTADEVNPLVDRWLQDRRRRGPSGAPYFLFVHYWDPHGPYAPPPPLDRREDGSRISVDYDMDRLLTGEYTLTPRALADTLELYDREISYVDRHVGALLESLRRDGALDDAVVILTSDHGESFGEHDHWEHSRVLYEDVLRVPFIMRLPGARAAGTVVNDAIAQPTDILPTVLSVVGLPAPEEIEGRDLTRALGREGAVPGAGIKALGLAFAELDRNVDWPQRWGARFDRDLTSARTLRYKFILSSKGQEELYDLDHDPGETVDLSVSDPGAAASMRSLAEAWRRAVAAHAGQGGSGEIDEGLKENLRSLGYVQ